MSDTIGHGYDTSIGTEERSARSATKFYAIILGMVFLIGLVLLGIFYNSSTTGTGQSGSGSSGRTDSSGQSPGP